MNWGLIPEVFYDLIARLVPGSLFLVGAIAVNFGPRAIAEALPDSNLASLLLFELLAYFAAIVLKEIWELGAGAERGKAGGKEGSDSFLGIRRRLPAEASGLIKLQAEKSFCEVLIPGLGILFLGNLWLAAARPSGDLTERIFLGLVFVISGVACLRWRTKLQLLYVQSLAVLQRLSAKEAGSDQRNNPVP